MGVRKMEEFKKAEDIIKEKMPDSTAQVLESAIKFFIDKKHLAEQFCSIIPTYYDSSEMWWLWDFSRRCYVEVDEVDLLNKIDFASQQANIISSKERNEILNALKQIARRKQPKEINRTWVQFNEEVVDLDTGLRFIATPEYFFVNPLPNKLGHTTDTPAMDKIFTEWVGEKWMPTLYEIIAYCIIRDYPIERIFCLMGGGSNGKSCYLKIIRNFLGSSNLTSTDLETLLKSRFETAKLRNKCALILGETNFENINNTQLLKRLVSGKDIISIEYKNKGFVDYINYAKIIMATNNLPTTDDKTTGFYRRWLIVDFHNQFDEKKDILLDIPEIEYENLGMKCISIAIELLKKREFTNEGCIAERTKRFEEKSNPFDKFYNEFVVEEAQNEIPKWEFEKELNNWCRNNKHREFSERMINKVMKEKGIIEARVFKPWFENGGQITKQVRCWVGVKWKN
jgi:putative DNA primase/helicase